MRLAMMVFQSPFVLMSRCRSCVSDWESTSACRRCRTRGEPCSGPSKKVLCASEQDRSDVHMRRIAWPAEVMGVDPRHLVFLDETWASTNLTRRYGRSRRGQRLIAKVPHGHWKTTTFVAALRHDGLTAPWVVDGAMNDELFLAYVQQLSGGTQNVVADAASDTARRSATLSVSAAAGRRS